MLMRDKRHCKNFVSKFKHNKSTNSQQMILVEYYSHEKELSTEDVDKIRVYLVDLFKFDISFTGKCLGRTLYNLQDDAIIKANDKLSLLIGDRFEGSKSLLGSDKYV